MAMSPYELVEYINSILTPDDTVVTDSGTTSYVFPQALKLPAGARYITDHAQGAMGFAIPAAIGVAEAKEKGMVYVITGDGSLWHQLASAYQAGGYENIKIYVLMNDGYKSIRDSQDRWCEGRYIGISAPHHHISHIDYIYINPKEEVRRPKY